MILKGYKLEAPKLEFNEAKHGDYLIKAEYSGHSQHGHHAKPEYISLAKTPSEPFPSDHETAGSYTEKYFHPKQF